MHCGCRCIYVSVFSTLLRLVIVNVVCTHIRLIYSMHAAHKKTFTSHVKTQLKNCEIWVNFAFCVVFIASIQRTCEFLVIFPKNQLKLRLEIFCLLAKRVHFVYYTDNRSNIKLNANESQHEYMSVDWFSCVGVACLRWLKIAYSTYLYIDQRVEKGVYLVHWELASNIEYVYMRSVSSVSSTTKSLLHHERFTLCVHVIHAHKIKPFTEINWN